MKLPAIKKLVNDYTVAQLTAANNSLLKGELVGIEVDGEDEGEWLTHIYAALWVKEHMIVNNSEAVISLRAYTAMVRNSFQ